MFDGLKLNFGDALKDKGMLFLKTVFDGIDPVDMLQLAALVARIDRKLSKGLSPERDADLNGMIEVWARTVKDKLPGINVKVVIGVLEMADGLLSLRSGR